MKTAEELNAIKAEYESMKKKLSELTEEEMNLVTVGSDEITWKLPDGNPKQYDIHIYTTDNDKKFN